MIFDTIALKAQIASEKDLSEIGSHDVFTVLMDLKDKGLLNFDYEMLTDGHGRQINCPSHKMKHMIREICRKVLGMDTVNEDMVREVEMRLNVYADTAVVPAETEEFLSPSGYPTIFFTLSKATSELFDAGAPYRVLGTTWIAGENGVAKQVNPLSYGAPVDYGRLWTLSISPSAPSSIFNTFDLMALNYGSMKMKQVIIRKWATSSAAQTCDLVIGAASIGGNVSRATIRGSQTIITHNEPNAAAFNLDFMETNNEMFGHVNFSNGLVVSWSKGGGDWD